ncbi:MAG: carbohydrate ABC transporter permease, partial [Humibacter sp.]
MTTTAQRVTAPARKYRPMRRDRPAPTGVTRWIILILVCLFALLVASPFLLLLLNSFKTENDYLTGGPLAWPTKFSIQSWIQYINDVDYGQVLLNSIVIAGLVAIFGVVFSLLASYSIGIGRVKGSTAVTAILLFATMLPQEALLYPLYYGMQALGLRNTIWSVIIIFTVLQGAFGTYLLSSLLGTFPKEVLEAASLDGASRWQILWRLVL